MLETLYLTDFVDIAILQEMQDSFSKMTGLASFITDTEGTFVTESSCPMEFCRYTRSSKEGAKLCRKCDIKSAQDAFAKGSVIMYHCHAGLLNFASPIVVEGRLIGCLHGGQMSDAQPDEEKIRETAALIGVNPQDYVNAYHKLPQLSEDRRKRSSLFLHTISNALSNIAYHNYISLQENAKIKRTTNLKSDFLANMSHEIRTPMNAIIGMAEMALREELPDAAREYVNQLKSSGKNLLAIINDILDFSKIESGKMEIHMAEYEPLPMIHDIAAMLMKHIGSKDVQLILDISPEIPYELLGDSLRIKQIFTHLANNAAKFTKSGYITLTYEPLLKSKDEVIMRASIQDTGIGIKKTDMDKLFQSFQQLDSKRNRNLEGTGLGLAISKRLLHLMMGSMDVESEFGKGSRFSFRLSQRITRAKSCISLKEPLPRGAAGLIKDPVVHAQLQKDISRLNVRYMPLASLQELSGAAQEIDFLFIEKPLYSAAVEAFVKSRPDITAVLMIPFQESLEAWLPNMRVVKKPLYSANLAMLFNRETADMQLHSAADDDYEFTAPQAVILIVDDSKVNLTVAEGLLKPLKMQIDTAQSGIEALEKIAARHYDLIFMDHQMPDLGGIETTRIIRRFHKEYATVPIIAFSADSSTETEMMFLNEGFNDCAAKPIELRMLIATLKRWLPKEKLQKVLEEPDRTTKSPVQFPAISIKGLDTSAALKMLGSEKLFWAVLKDYYQVIRKKAELIRQLEQGENWKNYTIEVHALKSASRQIGAMELSRLAADLEQAGNEGNATLIHQATGAMLQQYLYYDFLLAPYFEKDSADSGSRQKIPSDVLQQIFERLRTAVDSLDMDSMDEAVQEMGAYHFEGWQLNLYRKLKSAVEDLDVDSCTFLLDSWEKQAAAAEKL